jgi:dissimilatory sulfite reductase (desulfoviridin) alpha/beta subunit
MEWMENEIQGYHVETCFGHSGCPNRVATSDDLSQKIEKRLSGRKLKEFLRDKVKGTLKMHHEFRVSISDCPNACSRPQIVDLGLIGAMRPKISDEACTQCGACAEVCREGAISFQNGTPVLDYTKCFSCGQCLAFCLTGTLQEDIKGYRILLGGKLGRHPQLGRELPGIYGLEDTLELFERCLDNYKENCLEGERFGEVLNRTGLDRLMVRKRTGKKNEKNLLFDLCQRQK